VVCASVAFCEGNFADPWQHRTTLLSPKEYMQRGTVTAKWALRGGGQNLKFLPWAGAGVFLGYFMIQDALPARLRVL